MLYTIAYLPKPLSGLTRLLIGRDSVVLDVVQVPSSSLALLRKASVSVGVASPMQTHLNGKMKI